MLSRFLLHAFEIREERIYEMMRDMLAFSFFGFDARGKGR